MKWEYMTIEQKLEQNDMNRLGRKAGSSWPSFRQRISCSIISSSARSRHECDSTATIGL